jgi:sialate O-acetylesterase
MKTTKLQKLLGRTLLFTSLLGISARAFGSSKKRFLGTMASMVLFTGIAFADVKMLEVFGDHMVLQEGSAFICGAADPGEKITVTYEGVTANGVAGKEGEWKVELKGLKPSELGKPLKISGNNTLQFEDVIVGDVWVAAGQSNMEMSLEKLGQSNEIESKKVDPRIRLFVVPFAPSIVLQKTFIPNPDKPYAGKWIVATPETATKCFSAVGYYFAAELCRTQNKPIGMIACNRGGTAAQHWMSSEGLSKDPSSQEYYEQYSRSLEKFTPQKREVSAQLITYQNTVKEWIRKGADPRSKPTLENPFRKGRSPCDLFNGMVNPLIPFSIKGVIWYQGEANSRSMESSLQYATLFKCLIQDWREKWGQGDFPFYFVQLAGYDALKETKDHCITWPWLRDSQSKALELPNTGMATAIDLGNPTNIHPKNKYDVGVRLSLLARQKTYGEKIVATGPCYKGLKVEGNRIRITFDSVGGGLQSLTPPLEGEKNPWATETVLKGFEIAGSDQKFVPAKAIIDGDSVMVEGVDSPVAVRYGWDNVSEGNLYNEAKLPAYPFRTDDWDPKMTAGISEMEKLN